MLKLPLKKSKTQDDNKAQKVRLMLSKIEFVYKNRFKAGWFTLLKFTKKVRDEEDGVLRAELN